MLKKIKDIIRPPKKTGNPYDLKNSELVALKEIRQSPHWDNYCAFLDKLATFFTEDMLSASNTDTVLFYRSYILGLRRAGTIVDEIIREEQAKDARTESRTAKRDTRADTKHATFGSPYWSGE